MQVRWVVALAVAASCYQAPTGKDPCAIECAMDHSCPDGLSCDGRFCHAAGDSCHPAFTAVGAGTRFAAGIDESPFEVVPSVTDWSYVATGGTHTCAISMTMGLYCWGSDSYDQLGPNGVNGTNSSGPVQVTGLPMAAVAVAVANEATCAVLADGSVYCWGSNNYGQLGDLNSGLG